jgi:hypothetical protein
MKLYDRLCSTVQIEMTTLAHDDLQRADLLEEVIVSRHHVDLLDVHHSVGRLHEDLHLGHVLDHIEEAHLLQKEINMQQTHSG